MDINNDEQYENALGNIYSLMQKDIVPGSKESDELEVISILIKEYENKHYAIPRLRKGACNPINIPSLPFKGE